jgi:thioredoxin-related protein
MRKLILALSFVVSPAFSQETPSWFTESLLHLPDDVAEAAMAGKRVMLYFGQDGCPYCKQLMDVNFRQRPTVERMQKRFVALALNIWGDREVTWTDGKAMTEKQLAARLKVQFTPTLIFLDEKGGVALRLNGYYAPERFNAALDYASGAIPQSKFQSIQGKSSNEKLNKQPFFTDTLSGKPLARLFETPHCAECDALHLEVFTRPEVLEQLRKFDVMRFPVPGKEARSAKVDYVPTIVLSDARGREVIRLEAYFRPFHVAGALDYVASGAYRTEPSFQRFLQAKSDRLRSRGTKVDLWK